MDSHVHKNCSNCASSIAIAKNGTLAAKMFKKGETKAEIKTSVHNFTIGLPSLTAYKLNSYLQMIELSGILLFVADLFDMMNYINNITNSPWSFFYL
jgi:hypothetical protein